MPHPTPRLKRWSRLNTAFLWGTLILALVLVPWHLWHSQHRWFELFVCFAMVFAIGTAISAGYHRLFSHRAFEAAWPVRFLLLCFGAASFENSALKWASDHRRHHKHVDTPDDPYTIQRGFWYAHWIWVMENNDHPLHGVADLERDPLVRWQHRHIFLIGAAVSSIPVWIGLATGNVWGHVVIGVLLRIVLTHHTTFLINSAAHVFGRQPYTDANTARDNALLAPLTYGEGFHNFHHLWQWDYRNGVKWYQWDSTKWLLNFGAWMGLVRKLRRVPAETIRRAEVRMEGKALNARLDRTQPGTTEALRTRLQEVQARLEAALEAYQQTRRPWAERREEWRQAYAQRRHELQQAWAEWKALRVEVRRLAWA
ncbi:MAG: fatty acid desaturase [Firmicutes bacterium]|nr:fatty acid desaturase [Bacillota bacterium]